MFPVAGAQLEVRQGLTSRDYLLETVVGGPGGATSGNEHVVAADTGFYVRLRGAFTQKSKLAIVYSSFSYLGSEFMCMCVCVGWVGWGGCLFVLFLLLVLLFASVLCPTSHSFPSYLFLLYLFTLLLIYSYRLLSRH